MKNEEEKQYVKDLCSKVKYIKDEYYNFKVAINQQLKSSLLLTFFI